jgi:hypothetical protein
MRTVIESPTFQKQAEKIWSEAERWDFINWIAQNPTAGDIIVGAEGARKVRWMLAGGGKQGGARIIYFNQDATFSVYLLMIYTKSARSTVTAQEIKRGISNGNAL